MAATHLQAGNGAGLGMTPGQTTNLFASQSRFSQSSEAFVQRTVRASGVASKFWIRVTNNDTTGNGTIRSRVNGANGNIVVTITLGTTGEFTDASNSDTLAATDEYNFQSVNGTGGTDITVTLSSYVFTADSNTYAIHSAFVAGLTSPAESTTYYQWPAGGFSTLSTTETDRQTLMRSAGTLKNGSISR